MFKHLFLLSIKSTFMSLLDKLNWRYATKKFDSSKKIPAEKLQYILDAVQLAPSSIGLQHYRIVVIEDPEVREKLRAASFGQSQITDASQLIVFAAETNLNEAYADKFINLIASTRNTTAESLAGFKSMIVNTINNRTPEQLLLWAQKQTYIALGVLVSAAAEQDIDICPMEGFDAAAYDEILGLKTKGLTAAVIATIGYRDEGDPYSKLTKVRRPASELFIHI
jgi:nitroreductase/dihydropteridine reductase